MASYQHHSQQCYPFSLFTNLFFYLDILHSWCVSVVWLRRVAALLSPFPWSGSCCCLGDSHVWPGVNFDGGMRFVTSCCMRSILLITFCFAVNWSIEHLAMSLIVLSHYSEEVWLRSGYPAVDCFTNPLLRHTWFLILEWYSLRYTVRELLHICWGSPP